jgi:hypothetical protein
MTREQLEHLGSTAKNLWEQAEDRGGSRSEELHSQGGNSLVERR